MCKIKFSLIISALFVSASVLTTAADESLQPDSYLYCDWGNPLFCSGEFGEFYEGPRPDWTLFSYKLGGEWQPVSPTGWRAPTPGQVEAEAGYLIIEIDRDLLDSDLRCILRFQDSGSLYLRLLDSNGVAMVEGGTNLSVEGNGEIVDIDLLLPLSEHPQACVVAIQASGSIVYESLLCKADSFNLLSASALLAAARTALSESLAEPSTATPGGGESIESPAKDEDENDAEQERKRERERRGERADTGGGLVNLRVFTMME